MRPRQRGGFRERGVFSAFEVFGGRRSAPPFDLFELAPAEDRRSLGAAFSPKFFALRSAGAGVLTDGVGGAGGAGLVTRSSSTTRMGATGEDSGAGD
jgi:hypothetical protein